MYSDAKRPSEIPDYGVSKKVPQTFGQIPFTKEFTDSSKVSSPNKAELLYQDAYSLPHHANNSGVRASL
jgi:hypothetical protein